MYLYKSKSSLRVISFVIHVVVDIVFRQQYLERFSYLLQYKLNASVFHAIIACNHHHLLLLMTSLLFSGNNTCVDPQDLETLIRGIISAYDQGVIATNTTESADNWNLWSSFFFSATVMTTIGNSELTAIYIVVTHCVKQPITFNGPILYINSF